MTPVPDVPELSIGALAREVGVRPEVLRTWEARHGFPVGHRLASGHRRYRRRDVDLVRDVLVAKERGATLESAIRSVLAGEAVVDSDSPHAVLLRRHPEVGPVSLSHSAMLAISHAIEDACLAQATAPLVLGAFQRQRHLERAVGRWRELARTATWCAAFAAYDDDPPSVPHVTTVPLEPAARLRREWAVVCYAPDFAAVLSGWEVPSSGRRFEALVSTDPRVVRTAARSLVALAGRRGAAAPTGVDDMLATDAGARPDAAADAVWARAVADLDGRRER